jgi:hypothetical protein
MIQKLQQSTTQTTVPVGGLVGHQSSAVAGGKPGQPQLANWQWVYQTPTYERHLSSMALIGLTLDPDLDPKKAV